MNIRTRRFLLAIASVLDRRAQAIRRYVKVRTPKRVKRPRITSPKVVDRAA